MKKNNINEHDMTKKMMAVIRGGYRTLITEETDVSLDGSDQKDTLTPKKGDAVFSDDLKKLQDIVDPSVEIKNFKIYTVDKNVIIEGELINGRVKFTMSLRDDEPKIDTSLIDLTVSNNEILKKLIGYFKNWKDEWAIKLTNEYNTGE